MSEDCCGYGNEEKMKRLNEFMPTDSMIFDLSDFFKLFGDSSRLKILYVLKYADEMCVTHIASYLGMSDSAVSHQLKPLKDAKLIKSRRIGKTVFYSLDDDHVNEIIDVASTHIGEMKD